MHGTGVGRRGTGAGRGRMTERWVRPLAVAFALAASGVAGVGAQESDDEAVLATVRTLFDGMREKDGAKISGVLHEGAQLNSAGRDREGHRRVMVTPMESFIANVIGAEAYLDEVTFDERVLVDGDLAMAWTPYNLFVDGSFSHCGVDLFVMTRTDEGWKILNITDTRRREGCDPGRRG